MGHAYDSDRGAGSKYFDYMLDYYGEIELQEGDNLIELKIICAYKRAVNVKGFIFISTDPAATLTYSTKAD